MPDNYKIKFYLLIFDSLFKFNWWVKWKIWQRFNAIILFGFSIHKKPNYFYIRFIIYLLWIVF